MEPHSGDPALRNPARASSVDQCFYDHAGENEPNGGTTMSLRKALLTAVIGASALAFSAPIALAAVVCNGNVCWHVKEKYDYPPSAGVVIHEDSWKAGPEITFREHEGRGYWKGNAWTTWGE